MMPAPGANPAVEDPWPKRAQGIQEDEKENAEEEAIGAAAVDDEEDMPWYDWTTGRPPFLEEAEGWVVDDLK